MLISLLVVGAAVATAVRLVKGPDPRDAPTPPAPQPRDAPAPQPVDDTPAAQPDDEPPTAPPDPFAFQTDRRLALSGAALALNVGALAVGPPLALASAIPLTIVTLPVLRDAWRNRHDPDRRWVGAVDSVSLGGALLTGHFFAAAAGATLVFTSAKLLARTRRKANAELSDVFGELPTTGQVLRGDIEMQRPLAEIGVGERVIVRAGNIVPVDGRVVEGIGAADQRALTGESAPAPKRIGDVVFASTLVTEGPLIIEVTRTGEETTVGALNRLLQSTEDLSDHYRSTGETFVERGALPTLALSAITLPLAGVTGALAVSYSSFGYHMRIAAPLSALGHVAQAARQGVLVKDGRALELLARADVVLFDKTGTLTADRPEVVAVRPLDGLDPRALIRWAAAAEKGQQHPIAHALLALAEREGVPIEEARQLEVELGLGLRAWIDGAEIRVGSGRLMAAAGMRVPDEPTSVPGAARVFVAVDARIVGWFELITPARPEARRIIDDLEARGLEVRLVTGDHRAPAQRLAAELGIETVHAEVMPEDKSAIVREIQASGRRVCFIGDGINDAVALKAADVSISLSGASTAAVDTAVILMLDGDLTRLPDLFDLAETFRRNIERGKVLTVVPGVICVGEVYLLHAGLAAAIALYNVGLAGSVANALQPALRGLIRRERLE